MWIWTNISNATLDRNQLKVRLCTICKGWMVSAACSLLLGWILSIGAHNRGIIIKRKCQILWNNKHEKKCCGRIKYTNTHISTNKSPCLWDQRGYCTVKQCLMLWRPPAVTFTSVERRSVARQDTGPDRSMAQCPDLCCSVLRLKLSVPTWLRM